MNEYVSPLTARYASREMSAIFSEKNKVETYRKLWVALAKAQKTLGLPVTDSQIRQLEDNVSNIDLAKVHQYETKFKHDVMAHIHAFGDVCPEARGVIHWGATSSYVTDNTELIQLKQALELLTHKLLYIVSRLSVLAKTHASDPCLGFTHFQPAQPTTIGKRMCLWLQDFFWDAQEWVSLCPKIPFLGVKGATGTQSSFLALFHGNGEKVMLLEKQVAGSFGFQHIVPIAGQTYPRKLDVMLVNALASFAASAHKWATDFRLLAHEGEVLESFSEHQVGSSAMPYKRNPIYTERVCGLARFVISLAQNPLYTAATQWLERSLDDSSNRRLVLPEVFLGVDAVLNLMAHVLKQPDVRVNDARLHAEKQLPVLCMENILMHAVKHGADRQQAHEILRQLAFQPVSKDEFLAAVEKKLKVPKQEAASLMDLKQLVGRAPEQVDEFLKHDIEPFLRAHPVRAVSFTEIDR